MKYTFEFNNEEEREKIIQENKDKYLIEVNYLLTGNSLVFTTEKTVEHRLVELESSQIKQGEIDALKKQNAELSYLIMQGGAM